MRKLLGFFLGFGHLSYYNDYKIWNRFFGGNFPQLSFPVISIFLIILYIYLVRVSALQPDLTVGLSDEEMKSLPSIIYS